MCHFFGPLYFLLLSVKKWCTEIKVNCFLKCVARYNFGVKILEYFLSSLARIYKTWLKKIFVFSNFPYSSKFFKQESPKIKSHEKKSLKIRIFWLCFIFLGCIHGLAFSCWIICESCRPTLCYICVRPSRCSGYGDMHVFAYSLYHFRVVCVMETSETVQWSLSATFLVISFCQYLGQKVFFKKLWS